MQAKKKLSEMTDTKRKRGKQTHDFWPQKKTTRQKCMYTCVVYGTCINNNEKTKEQQQKQHHPYWRAKLAVEFQENTFAFFLPSSPSTSPSVLFLCCCVLCRYLSHAWLQQQYDLVIHGWYLWKWNINRIKICRNFAPKNCGKLNGIDLVRW